MMKHSLLALAGAVIVGTTTNAALVPPAGVDKVLYDWNFDGDGVAGGTVDSGASGTDWISNSSQSLKDAGWTLNTAADRNDGFYVSSTTFGGHLAINDLTSGTPEAELSFGGNRVVGFLKVEAGVAGNQNQQGFISLRDGTKDLACIYIHNRTSGHLVSGDGNHAFVDDSWNFEYRLHQIQWSVNADGTDGRLSYFFDAEAADGDLTVVNVPFITNGVPDRLHLLVGYPSSDVDRRILISGLTVMVPEPASLSLVALAGGLLVARRRRI